MTAAYDKGVRKNRRFQMKNRLIIDGNAVYEIDEECLENRQEGWGKRKRRCRPSEEERSRQDPGKKKTPSK